MSYYDGWTLADWEWAFNCRDNAIGENICDDGILVEGFEATVIEEVENTYQAGELEGRALVEQLWTDVQEGCRRLGCEGPKDIKWGG